MAVLRTGTSSTLPGDVLGGDIPLTLVVPRRSRRLRKVANALERVGLGTRSLVTSRGAFLALPSVMLGVATFADDTVRDAALNECGDDYALLDDWPLTLSSPLGIGDPTHDPPAAPWPDASGIAAAHAEGVDGTGVTVAVLDTGIDADHAEFAGRSIPFRHVSLFPNSLFWPPRDVRGFDAGGHGTHVCARIAGRRVGVAPGARLLVASVVESETTRTSMVRVAYGLDWILRQTSIDGQPAVLNMSVGFPSADRSVSPLEMRKRLDTLRAVLRTLVEANVLPVVAVGNDGVGECGLPAAFDDVLAVGAVNDNGQRAEFSGASVDGPAKPDLMGYGVGVSSANERDVDGRSVYRTRDGTSMAAPYVAGIAALYRSARRDRDVRGTWLRLTETALPLEQPWTGAGLARYVSEPL